MQYEGCCTLNIKKMKNDQHRRGCRKRYGRSRDPDLDVVDQLKAWIREVVKRGLSTAIENGVPEEIVWMQSGHANNPAARRYVELGSPALLYKTWEAFNL